MPEIQCLCHHTGLEDPTPRDSCKLHSVLCTRYTKHRVRVSVYTDNQYTRKQTSISALSHPRDTVARVSLHHDGHSRMKILHTDVERCFEKIFGFRRNVQTKVKIEIERNA